jgi:hypothetical protein
MRLSELVPRWIGFDGERLGLSFECPHCRSQRLAIAFHHRGRELVDDQHILAVPGEIGKHIWTLDGTEDFETLSLTPSIDASGAGHWHGFITGGDVR